MARFLKMHGCGNDFVVFDERAGPLGLTARRAAAIADRHAGVGCDQFIAIEPPPPGSGADASTQQAALPQAPASAPSGLRMRMTASTTYRCSQ
jgi:diaminopimelate epimerase